LLSEEYTITQKKIEVIFKGKCFSITTDGWTSFAHFINQETWELHSIDMGLFEKTGGSTADDVVSYCEYQLTLFVLSYHEAVSIFTDTEPTVIAEGQALVQQNLKGWGTQHFSIDGFILRYKDEM